MGYTKVTANGLRLDMVALAEKLPKPSAADPYVGVTGHISGLLDAYASIMQDPKAFKHCDGIEFAEGEIKVAGNYDPYSDKTVAYDMRTEEPITAKMLRKQALYRAAAALLHQVERDVDD